MEVSGIIKTIKEELVKINKSWKVGDKYVRIFPIVDLDANKTDLIKDVIDYFQKDYNTSIVTTDYEFQKGDNKLLIIRK